MELVFDFLENIALLTLVGPGIYLVERRRARLGPLRTQALLGLVFGTAALLVTATPLTLTDGATLDARAGPVILGGVLGGPIGAAITAVMGALSRGLVGGSFAFSGVAVYFVYALSGLALAKSRLVDRDRIDRPKTVLILAVASCLGAAAMFFLIQPTARAIVWLQNDLPLIWAANLVSVAYSAFIVGTAALFVRRNADALELNERLELAKRAGRFGTWDYNLKSGALKWDALSAEMHGLDAQKLDGALDHWLRYVHPDDLKATETAFQKSLADDTPFTSEYRVLLPGEKERIIKGDAIILRDGSGAPERVVGANLDLTELRRAEADLVAAQSIAREAQKFETIGQMTGGVAHDFNNLLAVIMGNQELLRDALVDGTPNGNAVDDLIEASIQATRRGAELTQNLLSYARQAQLTPESVDMNQVVRQTENLMRRTIESRVEIECDLQAEVWPILADRTSLQNALVNLLINARDALDGPGKVTIETKNVEVKEGNSGSNGSGLMPGRYVMLCVCDTGPGIAPEAIQKVFDPFYTTKPVGKGSGLGLSMVQGFVTQTGGTIRVESEPGTGARFQLYFPMADVAIPTPKTAFDGVSAMMPESGRARVLLVEDTEELLSVMKQALERAGYSIVTADCGDAAFALFKTDPHFDLVITDVVMPGSLQGPGLAKAIRMLAPDMRFIFFSGYAKEAVLHGNGLYPDDISLMKPVSRHTLLSAVRTALDENQPGA